MTRPNIVRADTLDLQDEDHPTAAEHHRPQIQGGLAPHQRAEVHHVLEERDSEEQSLQDAWNLSGNLTAEPDAIDQAQEQHAEQEHTTNGTAHEGQEGGEGADSEADGEDELDRISSSPSIDDEEIDFEFVYALHTFVATVEGQANATKGDTMVLLDDSNSYWWLVRVVKDSSIGYLPAEHIETPTERLARLNKHRNIDLSATMLSDNSEKTRNPLKKAIRRRNAKTVQFAAPTYVEASDYDYSTEDEDQPVVETFTEEVQAEEKAPENGEPIEEEQPAEKRNSWQDENGKFSTNSSRASFDREQAATAAAALDSDELQLSPKLVDKTEAAPLKSRRTRNTDSFLKDDSIETRKITLTPGLLREDGTVKNSLSTDSARTGSMENLVKQVSPPEQLSKKDSKKEKEKKKGSMLSGLFKSKKKDKKTKEDLGEMSDVEKVSSEYPRGSPIASPSQSGRGSPSMEGSGLLSSTDTRRQEIQTRPPSRGRLQKAPPQSVTSPVREQPSQPQEEAPKAFLAELQGSEAAYEMAAAEPDYAAVEDQAHLHTELALEDKQQKEGSLSPLTNMLKRDDSKTQKPTKAKRAKQRVELDDFDSPADEEGPNPFKEQEERAAASKEDDEADTLSESPVEVTASGFNMHGTEVIHIPTPSPYEHPQDEEEEDETEEEEPESLTSSPSIIEHPAEPFEERDVQQQKQDDDPTPTARRSPNDTLPETHAAAKAAPAAAAAPTRGLSSDSSNTASSSSSNLSAPSPASQQTWSDTSLRAWLEDGSEVKDMMTMIHDKSGVVPVSEDHPMMVGLFTEERKGVQSLTAKLDGLLGEFLGRRGIALS